MLSRERVQCVIDGGRPDRIPIYGWVWANLSEPIAEAFGSVAAFEDAYEFDFAHLFGGPSAFRRDEVEPIREADGPITPQTAMELANTDPDDTAAYADIVEGIRHHKHDRGRFVYVQTPGIFEALNGLFGIENHLAYLLLYPDAIEQVYRRQAEWNRRFAMNCLDLGVDMIHVSDDWGSQNGPLFSPEVWWRMIYPAHKVTCDAVKERGAVLSLHCDGDFSALADGVVKLGYDVVHPWQESAGMSLQTYKDRYRGKFVVMGGLDVQTTVGFGRPDVLRAEIERVMRMFADGGLLFCTTHFIQAHCTIQELRVAFDTAYELSREVCK